MKTITENASRLKYKIKPMLAELTESKRLLVAKKVKSNTGISDATYSRYINARMEDSTDIPGYVLSAFADRLTCSVDELYNND